MNGRGRHLAKEGEEGVGGQKSEGRTKTHAVGSELAIVVRFQKPASWIFGENFREPEGDENI